MASRLRGSIHDLAAHGLWTHRALYASRSFSMTRMASKQVRGGVTAPRGFLAAGMHAGIKKAPASDLALLISREEGPIAGVFTTNRVVAAPVLVDRQHLRRGRGRAILINSGNANACTGRLGMMHAREMVRQVAGLLATPLHTVFVGSTGVIGQPLPISKIRKGVARLITRLRSTGGADAADAILTTDTRVKQVALQARIAGRRVTVGGMAKGSGMIHPDMATMLAYLTTDVAISQRVLQKALRAAVDQSFHCISVDGETSTNDTVLCLANGMAGNPMLREGVPGLAMFQRLLNQACTSLALQVCRDGEGVTKVVEVVVRGARTAADAKQVARTIGTSNLVKTAWFGEDANWGRILAAIGRSGVPVDHKRISLAFEDRPVVRRGTAIGPQAERRVSKILRRKEFSVTADLGLGKGTARLWTNDLSYKYVEINASYRS